MVRQEPSVLREGAYEEGLRWQIHQGPYNLTAYVGIPEGSRLAGLHYDELDADEDCPSPHGGWTFSEPGEDRWPAGWYWWGWDYGHFGDHMSGLDTSGGHLWTVEEVQAEVEELLPTFATWLRQRQERPAVVEDEAAID